MKMINSYRFQDNSESLFNAHSYECGLPSKISDVLNFEKEDLTVRFCDNSIICVGHGIMIMWRYCNNRKGKMSPYTEYQLPHSIGVHHANQALKMCNNECVFVSDEGHVRYWPNMVMSHEYIDHQIDGMSNDECLMVDEIEEKLLVIVFRSRKIVVADLRDRNIGLTFKVFMQPLGFISGMSRYLSSFIVSAAKDARHFRNIKVNYLLPEETELLIMTDNNIDSLILDVLLNGQYKREILSHDSLKKSFVEFLSDTDSDFEVNDLSLDFGNFDLCINLLYVFVQIQSKGWSNVVLFTYNRQTSKVITAVVVDLEIVGEVELKAIVDDSAASDEPCLLAAVKDNHNIYIVEVLTGCIKCHLDTETKSSINQSIFGWTCPILNDGTDMMVVALTSSKQLVAIHQKVPLSNKSFTSRGVSDYNISNTSFSELNASQYRHGNAGDVSSLNASSFPFIRPSALSTPLSKFDKRGNRLNETDLSMTKNETMDDSSVDANAFDIFRKSVMLYWQGYKSQANRTLIPISERARLNNDISLPMFILNVTRDIIDEYPSKDPRWSKVNNANESNRFLYSNKSLLMPQQIHAKKDSLRKLLVMLKENDIDLLGPLGNVAPMSVCQSLYLQKVGTQLPLLGGSQVTWSVAHCVGFGVELLEFARVLNEVMSCSTNCEEINQILGTLCQHVLAIQGKLAPLEIISQEVSLIPRFIRQSAEFIKRTHFACNDSKNSNLTDQSNGAREMCTQLAKILSACLRSSLVCRQQFEESFLSVYFNNGPYAATTSAPCWITEKQPLGVLDSVFDIVNFLLDLSRSFDDRIFESTIEIVTVLLDCFKHRLDWMRQFSINDTDLERLEAVYYDIRSQLIGKIVQDERGMELGLSLADKYADFEWLTSICETLDTNSNSRDSCHIDTFLRKWSNDGLSEFVLDWYQDKLKEVDQRNQGKLLAKIQKILEKIQRIEGTNNSSRMDSSVNSQVIGKFLEKPEVQATRWLHDIEIGDFVQAASTLSRLAELEQASLTRRKSLLGLAKLSYLASSELTATETDRRVQRVNRNLAMIHFQEDIPLDVLEKLLAVVSTAHAQPVLKFAQLVKLLLAAVPHGKNTATTYFVRALELMAFSGQNDDVCGVTTVEWQDLLLTVWRQIIGQDDWSTMVHADACLTSSLYRVFTDASDRGLPMDLLLPEVDKLFPCIEGADNATSTDVEFLIRRTFELLAGDMDGLMEHDDDDNDIMCA